MFIYQEGKFYAGRGGPGGNAGPGGTGGEGGKGEGLSFQDVTIYKAYFKEAPLLCGKLSRCQTAASAHTLKVQHAGVALCMARIDSPARLGQKEI